MERQFDDADEGKTVMTATGDTIGRVETVRDGEAHVRPEAGLSQTTRRRLGWTKRGEDTYVLHPENVDEVTADGIRLDDSI